MNQDSEGGVQRFNLSRVIRDVVSFGPMGLLMFVFAATLLTLAAPQPAQAAGTCTINWGTVPYRSTGNTFVMSTSQNPAVLAACDPRYPAVDSGVAAPTSGTSTGGGTWSGVTNASDNTLTFAPHSRWAGPDTYTMYFCNDAGCSGAGRLTATVNVTVAAPTLTLTPTLANGTVATAYSQTLTAGGGASPYTFSVISGSLPPGLSLGVVSNPNATTSTVTLSGTPTAGGTFNFTIRAQDNSIGTGPFTIDQPYTVTISPPTITVTTASVPNGTEGSAYGPTTLAATGGTSPYTWTVSGGALPPGLALSAGGVLSGTPTGNGSFNFTARAQDSSTGTGPYFGTRAYSFSIAAIPPVANPVSRTVAHNSSNNSLTLSITGGAAASVAVATPPTHGTATPSGLAILYTPTPGYAGPDSFTYTATNTAGTSAPATVTVTVSPPTLVLNPVSLPDGTMGVAYNQTTTASGGQAPYTYSISAGALPAGLSINPGTGAITGTPTAMGPANFTVRAQDSSTGTGAPFAVTRSYAVDILAPPVMITSPAAGALPGATGGVAYSQTFTASGGQTPHSFALASGSLPAGVTLSTGGALSGTPSVSGTFNFTVTATDSSPNPGPYTSTPVAYSLTVTAPTITVSPTTLPNGTTATAYSQTVTATGGTAPRTFSVTSGTLPTGLSLDGATGAISGTLTAANTYNFTITATDNLGFIGSRAYTVVVANPVITLSPAAGALPGGTGGVAYSQTFTASGGQGTHSVAQTGGTLPPGLSLVGGVLSGTPTAAGTFNFSLTGTDASPAPGPFNSAPVAYSITITAPAISVSPITLPNATTALAYSQTITATGGTAPHGFAVTAGTLPTGLALAAGGGLTGTPTAAGNYSFTVTATDNLGFTGSRAYTVAVANPVITLSPAAGALPGATGGVAYSQTFTASGGQGTHSVAQTGGTLPPGLSLVGGVLSGTPTAAGTFNFSLTGTDASPAPGPFNSGPVAYSITVTAPTITVSPTTLPNGTTATAYSQTVTASGGTTPHTFSVTAGALPTGLSLDGATGVISGTLTAANTYNFTVTATDNLGFIGSRAYTVVVADPVITVTSPSAGPLPGGTGGVAYSQTFTASGGQGGHTFAVSAGSLPAGVTLSAGGSLSGTPTVSGNFNFSVTATDSSPTPGGPFTSAPVVYSLAIVAPTITVNPTTLPNATTALAYSQTITATGGTAPHGFAVTAGTLPTGLALAAGGGLTGTPTAAGNYSFTVTATDNLGFTGSRAYTVAVANPVITLSPAAGALPGATGGVAYSQTFTASGGQGTHSVAQTGGTLPPGLSLVGGVLSGTPTAAGTFNFSLTGTDASPAPGPFNSGPVAYSITVTAPAITVSPLTLPNATTAVSYSDTITATGGTAPYSFTVTAGTLPTGLSLDGATGVISGTLTAANTYNFTVTATDNLGFIGSRAYTVVVADPVITVTSPSAGPLPGGTGGVAYSQTFTANGGQGGHTFAVSAGSLPAGVTLSAGGSLSGTPTVSGNFNFSVTATDSSPTPGGPFTSAPVVYSLAIVAPTITVNPTTLPNATTALAYSQTITATGGTAPHGFAVTAGTLPTGLILAAGGGLTGTPTAAGNYSFTVTATDNLGFTGSRAYTVAVANPVISVTSPATGALPGATGGTAYSQTFTASGGQGTHTFALAAGSLPAGVTLSAGGVLSGTPTVAGIFNFTIRATDASPAPGPFSSAPVAYSLTVTAPTVTLSPTSLPNATTAVGYSQTFTASGGTAPYGFSLPSGTLPIGMILNSAGAFSGTPSTAGTYNFTIRATDTHGFTGNQAYTVVVADPVITISSPAPGPLPGGTGGSPYSQTFTASGGQGAHSFSLVAGTLPIGTAFSSAGVLSGTPTVAGTFNFTLRATDSSPGVDGGPFTSAPVTYSLTIAAPTITINPTSLPDGVTAVLYNRTLTASGGTAPYSFSLPSGSLPIGTSFSSAGVLSGTPSVAGTYSFTVRVTDTHGFTANQAYTVVVADPVVAITAPAAGALPGGTGGSPYSQTFTASGGQGPHSFSLVSGTLPIGVAFSSAGVLSGTPTAAGTFNFTLRATDSSPGVDGGPFTSAPVAYSVTIAAPSITVGPASLPAAATAASYSQTFTASGGTAPYSFSLPSGAPPIGMSLNSAGAFSGTPTAAGTYNFTIRATDTHGFTGDRAYTVVVADPTITLTSPAAGALPGGVGGTAYSQAFTATGGQGAHSFTVASGSLPPGVTLSTGGTLSGIPTAAGNYSFSVRAADASPAPGPFVSASVAYTLQINAPTIVMTPAAGALPGGLRTVAYSQTISASGGTAPYSFTVATGTLPAGLTLTTAGVLAGTPTTAGSNSFTVTATDAHGFTQSAAYTLAIGTPIPVVQPKTVSVVGGQSVIIDAAQGATGLDLIAAQVATPPSHGTAVASGLTITYTANGAYAGPDSFTYTVTNPGGVSAPATVTITVNPAVVPAPPKTVTIMAGQTATVELTQGAFGAPFTGAAVVSVTPAGSGAATISGRVAGGQQLYDLTFKPVDSFTGNAVVTYTLSNAFTTGAPGTVTIVVQPRPDPTKDAEVTGLIAAQGETARRFATAQIGNINRRLEQLHGDGEGGGGFSSSLSLSSGGALAGGLANDPSELRRMQETFGVIGGLSGRFLPGDRALGFDGSPERRQDDLRTSGMGGGGSGPWGVWVSGAANFGRADDGRDREGFKFNTDGLTIGVDRRLSEKLVLGGALGWATDTSKIGGRGTRSEADAWSLSVYGSFQPTEAAWLDVVLGYGKLDFDSKRYVTANGQFAYGQRDGDQWFGAVTAGWDYRHPHGLKLSPYGRIEASRSTLGAFTETGGGAFALAYEEQTTNTVTGAIGLRGEYALKTRFGRAIPSFRIEYAYDLQGSRTQRIRYADWLSGNVYSLDASPLDRNRMLYGLGLDLLRKSGTRFGLDYEGMLSNDQTSSTVRIMLETQF
ncbi:putative Ig domain-containing protein [Caulobacter mirabilis]|uniref:Autotransporter outer membrane beta-barrel domain-containing protein n=1 Tax=Caulobacter mirabilis TaxID=69666 RepID=A0A2D2B1K4_9CAUL|nr:putative Ig domain-containing protein [Caulobacter mirabilis]ATQ44118.1 autotransporter outer membrane beta-barrel domain-containing protein [Caulobacter mirabilis]